MTFHRPGFTAAFMLVACGLCCSLPGCSDAEDSSTASTDGDTAGAVANAAAPKLAEIQSAASGNSGGPPEDDYGSGSDDYDSGSDEDAAHGGAGGGGDYGGGMASRGPGGMSPGGMSPGGMDPGGMDPGGMSGMDPGGMNEDYGDGSGDVMGDGSGNTNYGSGNSSYGGGGSRSRGNGQNRSSLPADFNQWSDQDYVTAAKEKNEVLVAAIQTRASQAVGDPGFTDLMGRVLSESAGVPAGSSAPGGFMGLGPSPSNRPDPAGKRSNVPYIPKHKVPPGGAFKFPTAEERFHQNRSHVGLKVSMLSPTESAASSFGLEAAGLENEDFTEPKSLGFDTIEMMIAESLLGYSPQASAAMGSRAQGAAQAGSAQAPPGIDDLSPPGGMGAAFGGGQQGPGGPPGLGGPPSIGGPPGLGGQPSGGGQGRSGRGPGSGGQFGQNGSFNSSNNLSGSLPPEALVQAVVNGLATSNTPQSWKMLQDIYDGNQPTPLQTADAQGIVLSGVLGAKEFDSAVVQTLLRTAVENAISNPQSNQKSLEVLAAAGFQTTGHYFKLVKTRAPSDLPPPGGPGGMSGPSGDGGEGEYGGGEYGDGSYGGGFGGGNKPPAPPSPKVRISPTMFPILAEVLWDKDHVSALAAAISASGDLQTAEPLMPLAVTIPNDDVRKAVFAVLEGQYKSGAKGLASVGFFTNMLSDPGMIPILKSLPRQRPPRKSSAANVGVAAAETPESTWTDGTKEAVMALRDRLRTAAGNPELAYDGAMPVRLHRNAIAQRSIRFTTTNDDIKALGASVPSQTTYYYASCTIAPTRASELEDILEHYEKRAKSFKRLQSQSLLWFDGMKTTNNGSRISMDVIVEDPASRGGGGRGGGAYGGGGGGGGDYGGGPPGSGGGGRGSGQYEIEVIIVEVHDPKAVMDADAASPN